jgi:hypothetical protein
MSENATRKPRGKPFTPGDPRAGRPKGARNKATEDVKALALGLVEDPSYRAKLQADLRRRQVNPAVEAMLWHYAYGKPKDTIALEGEVDVNVTAARESLASRIARLSSRITTGDVALEP